MMKTAERKRSATNPKEGHPTLVINLSRTGFHQGAMLGRALFAVALGLIPSSALRASLPSTLLRTHRTLHRRCAPPVANATMPSAEERAKKLDIMKVALSTAISTEKYEEAARLRDQLNSLQVDDEVAVLQANAAFYNAFTAGDLKAMSALWVSEGEETTCAHPGFPHLHGIAAILDSWQQIFANSNMKIQPEKVRCKLLRGGLSATVTCVERVDGPGDNALTATNVFEKSADGHWRMITHQAGPVVSQRRADMGDMGP